MDPIEGIQNWYKSHCNGEWEHRSGVNIRSCDNPGWWVTIDLKDTELENRKFETFSKNVSQKKVDFALGKIEEYLGYKDEEDCGDEENIITSNDINYGSSSYSFW